MYLVFENALRTNAGKVVRENENIPMPKAFSKKYLSTTQNLLKLTYFQVIY